MRWKHVFSAKSEIAVLDFWEMREGDSVGITSRIDDLPPWFEIHPTEVSGPAVYWMLKRLENGYKPGEPLERPNLWRIRTGDRLVWVKSPDLETSEPRQAVFAFRCDALVFGDRHVHPADPAWFLSFGAPLESSPSGELTIQFRAGLEVVSRMGLPREMADIGSNWTLG